MRIAIIGFGNIGKYLANWVINEPSFELRYIVARKEIDKEHIDFKNQSIKFRKEITSDLIEDVDIIIECANKDVVSQLLKFEEIDRTGKKMIIISTGGLYQNKEIINKLKKCEIIIPVGAIAGLDAIKAINDEITSIELKTTKHPKSLEGAPFFENSKVDLSSIKTTQIIWEGEVSEAVNLFPKNINVAASIYFASKCDNLKITIVADPNATSNMHEITCAGGFGKIYTRTENQPSPDNPKTSFLAVKSVVSILRNMNSTIKIN
ncbi:aspartate dehydrogenase [Cellulophaga algicola DSM 14237]|uniref:Aspartate dehydrogenase n=1 Tax=Cellulophaga algicola (strain DSM 14237 / IC166 / ACAM 630) TaxID=688270 RepID=E6X8L6_CELAD|nr:MULTISPECIES: aspartate dehydrogenase domain-containing protein [Cellulophaga]ADV47603.1 aspartate dehydrogenase [Cellulophaga algicola DSM 14237]